MAESKTPAGTNGSSAPEASPPQVRIMAQYIKDFSFENPNVEKMLSGPGEQPNINIEVNVGARRMSQPNLYESAIEFGAKASNKAGIIYETELVYAGLFQLQNIPEQALEPFLLINCPTLLFPFVRRIILDMTREAGYPPLMLDPLDFAGLYMQRLQSQQATAQGGSGPGTLKA